MNKVLLKVPRYSGLRAWPTGKDKSCLDGICAKAIAGGVAEGQDQALGFSLNVFFLSHKGNESNLLLKSFLITSTVTMCSRIRRS